MTEEALVYVERNKLRQLMKDKLIKAGLPETQADKSADLLIFADEEVCILTEP